MMSTPYWSSPMAKLMNSTSPAALATLSPAPAAIDPSLTLSAEAVALSVVISHHLIVGRGGNCAMMDRGSPDPTRTRAALAGASSRCSKTKDSGEQEAAIRPIQASRAIVRGRELILCRGGLWIAAQWSLYVFSSLKAITERALQARNQTIAK